MVTLNVSWQYLLVVFLLWIAQVGSAIWGWPVWTTITFMSFFAIYTGHEWMHIWVCKSTGLIVEEINFDIMGSQDITFSGDKSDPNLDEKAAKVYLAGSVWDSIWWTIAALSSIFYANYQYEITPLMCGSALLIVLILNLAWPGSDWQEFRKRTTLRA